jgi:23S rRNA pseudouridine2605 synthase
MNAPTRTVLSLKRSPAENAALEERLHKVLANAGLGSRRLLETRIEAGEVKVNGQVAALGSSVRAGDRVEMDGKLFVAINDTVEQTQLLIYHKPEGVVTTREDPEGRPTVFEQLPRLKGARWIAVGRLDINTTGLLLLTTDGALAHTLMHPSTEVEREYICRVHGEVPDSALEQLKSGVMLEDGPAHFEELAVISRGDSHSWFRVVLREGRNREVRRMWEAQGLMVSRLKRIRYGNIELPRALRKGGSQMLESEQVTALRDLVGAGEAEPVLTLQPVIGQRRAKPSNEFRPEPRTQQAWTGSYQQSNQDEARELRAFDRVRDDPRPVARRKPKPGRGAPRGNPNAAGRDQPGRRGPPRGPGAANSTFAPRTRFAGDPAQPNSTRKPRPSPSQGQPPGQGQPPRPSHGNTFEANEGRALHLHSAYQQRQDRPARPGSGAGARTGPHGPRPGPGGPRRGPGGGPARGPGAGPRAPNAGPRGAGPRGPNAGPAGAARGDRPYRSNGPAGGQSDASGNRGPGAGRPAGKNRRGPGPRGPNS